MKTLTLTLILCLLASGCTTLDAAQDVVAKRGASAADEARESAEWTLCHGISIGAWRRAYGSDPQRADAWARLCAEPEATPR